MAPQLDRHVVTALLVAHEGARWLPETLKALLTQSHPIDRLVAADTGSTDAGPALLTEVVGEGNLILLPAETGYADAVAQLVAHPASSMVVPMPEGAAAGDRIEWIWLLHDDSAPAPDALERMLLTAQTRPPAAILGPKLRDWDDRRVLLEAGVAIDRTGRRETGLDLREFDQGQHDFIREVMAVSTAGMLVRRDVWDELGGLDPTYGLFRDDVDFGWRAYAAGHRVLLAPDAVVYHAEAAARGDREVAIEADDRRNALLVLFANLPMSSLALSMPAKVLGSLLRALLLTLAKRPDAARAELRALYGALRGMRRIRRTRAQGFSHSGVSRFQPRWPTLRRLPDLLVGRRLPLPVPERGVLRRWLRRPGVLLGLTLTAISLVAGRDLLATGGRLGGGALVPAWGGASDLWAEYISGWHPVGLGSAAGSPPYAGVLAALSTVLFGKPWLAVLLLLLGGVPLAGLTAYAAARRILAAGTPVALWAGATYALAPVATGAVTTGRVGTLVVIVLLPLIGLFAHRMLAGPARHEAWATGLLIAVAMAFVPMTWPLVAMVSLPAAYALGGQRAGAGRRLVIALAVPPLLLLPWTLRLLAHPSGFLREAGLPAAVARPTPHALMMLSPGGPGVPAAWVTAGLAAVGLTALLLPRRRMAVLMGWLLALSGLLVAILVMATRAWPGTALMFAAAGIVLAASGIVHRATGLLGARWIMHRMGAVLGLATAVSTPLLAAGLWVAHGTPGPLVRARADAFPLVVESRATLPRLLVLSQTPGGMVRATVLRGRLPVPGEEETQAPEHVRRRLRAAVNGIASGTGGATALTRFGVQYVIVPHPDRDPLVPVLDAVADLSRLGRSRDFALWGLTAPAGRLTLLDGGPGVGPGGGTATPLATGPVDARVRIPAGAPGRVLLLAEPAGGWRATLGGRVPRSRTVDGWAQAYDVPPAGGEFVLRRDVRLWHVWVSAQGLALVLVAVLALPSERWAERSGHGRRRRRDDEAPEPSPALSGAET